MRAMGMVLAFVGIGLAACDGAEEQACTLIGCGLDGVRLELAGAGGGEAPAGVYRVSATSASDGSRQCDFTLPASGTQPACRVGDAGVTWFGFAPAQVTIVVTRDQQTVHDAAHDVTYSETRPNGPGCDPVCRDGAVAITLE